MDANEFDRSVGDLAGTLGDATRRGIYIAVRESPEPMTSSQIAAMFDIHPNVARHHLDRLSTDGYLEVSHRRAAGKTGPGAGRPAKCYTASGKSIDIHYPVRRMDLFTNLLLQVIGRLDAGSAATIAYEVGREHGEGLAEEIGMPTDDGYETSVRAVARAMTGLGFDMTAEPESGRLLTSTCPFGDVARSHPTVVCSLDRGLVEGLLSAINTSWEPVVFPHPASDDACVTEVVRS